MRYDEWSKKYTTRKEQSTGTYENCFVAKVVGGIHHESVSVPPTPRAPRTVREHRCRCNRELDDALAAVSTEAKMLQQFVRSSNSVRELANAMIGKTRTHM